MAGSHAAPPRKSSKWKVVVLVLVILIVLAALGSMVYLALSGAVDLQGLTGGGSAEVDVPDGITTQIAVQDGRDKNVGGQIAVTQGLMRPDSVDADEDLVLLDISWDGSKDANYPLKITVSDPGFPDGDGLAVHHYNESSGAWELIGTYLIENHSVTFPASSLSPFAFQVISANPEPTPTPEPTAEPTPTPEPTPEPTPAPIMVEDYGAYAAVQDSVSVLAEDMDDDGVYVVALVRGLPQAEAGDNDEDDNDDIDEDEEDDVDEVAIGFVETEGDQETEDADAAVSDAAVSGNSITATVLVNMDGQSISAIEMGVSQTEDGAYYLTGPVTEGMLWTANADYYNGSTRYSLENNGRYLNLDDSDETVVLDDNSVRTRWLFDSEKMDDGTTMDVLTYRDNSTRYYISDMGTTQVRITGETPAADTEDGDSEDAAEETTTTESFSYESLRLAVTDDSGEALQFVIFRLDEDMEVPDDVITSASDDLLSIPSIDEDTDLDALAVTVGGKTLANGTDYTISSRQIGDTVIVTFTFNGDYVGQVIRTYSVYVEPEPTPTPEPTATPTYDYTYTEQQSAPTATATPVPTTPEPAPAVDPASGSDTQVSTGTGSDTDT